MNLPRNPIIMDGALAITIKPTPVIETEMTIAHFLPILSAIMLPNKEPKAAPKEKNETKNSLSYVVAF